MEEIDRRFEQALASHSADSGLHALALVLKSEGMSQEQMYALFNRHQLKHHGDTDEGQLDAILDVMDQIVGHYQGEYAIFDTTYDAPIIPMGAPPKMLNGAEVLVWWTTSLRKTLYYICENERGHAIQAMAICRCRMPGAPSESLQLLECDGTWDVVKATAFASLAEAMAATTRWAILPGDWKPLAPNEIGGN